MASLTDLSRDSYADSCCDSLLWLIHRNCIAPAKTSSKQLATIHQAIDPLAVFRSAVSMRTANLLRIRSHRNGLRMTKLVIASPTPVLSRDSCDAIQGQPQEAVPALKLAIAMLASLQCQANAKDKLS